MATSPRIEELRKKFDENPRRYFAPLANEYRKAGDVEQAIAICREYLPQQPGHMSGHIVYAQALFEAGQLEEAQTVFETALSLDPENLIALRHLGDIAARTGNAAAARGWYQRVLDADPRNEEIAALITGLGAVEAEAPPQAAAEPAATEPAPVAELLGVADEQGSDAPLVIEQAADAVDGLEPTSHHGDHGALALDTPLAGLEATAAPALEIELPGGEPALGQLAPAPELEHSEPVVAAESLPANDAELPAAGRASAEPDGLMDLELPAAESAVP
ncbi:MAG TPA: tetratricopeptide repeat protein, partial [Gemmatimonadaceae bacterium]|nr:tetratricopeptide repeat protein [Gemmatimonadaceae bacterium]